MSEVAVVGKSDTRWGEVPVAVVVRSSDITAEEIIEGCAQIARFRHPREVLFVDELPRNSLGKVLVHAVKALVNS